MRRWFVWGRSWSCSRASLTDTKKQFLVETRSTRAKKRAAALPQQPRLTFFKLKSPSVIDHISVMYHASDGTLAVRLQAAANPSEGIVVAAGRECKYGDFVGSGCLVCVLRLASIISKTMEYPRRKRLPLETNFERRRGFDLGPIQRPLPTKLHLRLAI